jgi:hypothetical protein
LGRTDLDAVYVEHPIQDQTPQEIAAKAEAVIDEIVARLTISTVSDSERGFGYLPLTKAPARYRPQY